MKNIDYLFNDFITDLTEIDYLSLHRGRSDELNLALDNCIGKLTKKSVIRISHDILRSLNTDKEVFRESSLLISISDKIYFRLLDLNRAAEPFLGNIPKPKMIFILNFIEEILFEIRNVHSFLNCLLKVTKFGSFLSKFEFKGRLQRVSKNLVQNEINCDLIKIIDCSIKQYLIGKKLTYEDLLKIDRFFETIIKLTIINDIEVEKLLIVSDFAPAAISAFRINRVRNELLNIDSLYDQAIAIINHQEEFALFKIIEETSFYSTTSSTVNKIEFFYKILSCNFSKKINLHQMEANHKELTIYKKKLNLNLSVAQLGLFIRLAMEIGWISEKDVSRTFEFFAKNYSTQRAPFISHESLQKKSLDVEFSTAKKMKTHLIMMINHINQHYNTSNF